MRASKPTVLVALAALSLASVAIAAGKANPNRGKALYKASCKACHVKGGEAKDLTPLSKTQLQWQRAFKSVVLTACAKKAEAKTGKPLTADDLADMELFLVSHAADSDQPETCGQ